MQVSSIQMRLEKFPFSLKHMSSISRLQNLTQKMDRTSFSREDSVKDIWQKLGLPLSATNSLSFKNDQRVLPSSFKLDQFAQSCLGLTTLAAEYFHSLQTNTPLRGVQVDCLSASLEFKTERFYTLNGSPAKFQAYFGGLYKTSDGYVRIHDLMKKHRDSTCRILDLPAGASSSEVAIKCLERKSKELEEEAFKNNAVIGALRSPEEWDASPQGITVPDFPIAIQKRETEGIPSPVPLQLTNRCLEGLRVVELSRVIAAPVAGRALAAYGADVTWVTSPSLEDVPALDHLLSFGKQRLHLDLDDPKDVQKLHDLTAKADVFIQGYRPTSLAKRGFSFEELSKINPNLVYASLSAYPQGMTENGLNPWRFHRGFDSIVQTCTGLNMAEQAHWDSESTDSLARPLPCQALDHGTGYLLAIGILAALCKQRETGGAYLVEASLAATSRYIRSFGQLDGKKGFDGIQDVNSQEQLLAEYGTEGEKRLVENESESGLLRYLNYAGHVEGTTIGWSKYQS